MGSENFGVVTHVRDEKTMLLSNTKGKWAFLKFNPGSTFLDDAVGRYHILVIDKGNFPDDVLEITAWTDPYGRSSQAIQAFAGKIFLLLKYKIPQVNAI
ncbi:hypothetical protein V2J09_022646 [Rumex salicifolius]